jgi:hypothetical protein
MLWLIEIVVAAVLALPVMSFGRGLLFGLAAVVGMMVAQFAAIAVTRSVVSEVYRMTHVQTMVIVNRLLAWGAMVVVAFLYRPYLAIPALIVGGIDFYMMGESDKALGVR